MVGLKHEGINVHTGTGKHLVLLVLTVDERPVLASEPYVFKMHLNVLLLVLSMADCLKHQGSVIENNQEKLSFKHRILGGLMLTSQSFGAAVYLNIAGRSAAGTFIVIDDHQLVVSAAHVLRNGTQMIRPRSIRMTFGKQSAHAATEMDAKSYIFYENVLHPSGVYGIVLIVPKHQVQINEFVSPAHLYGRAATIGMKCATFGWGMFLRGRNSFNESLRFGLTEITSKKDCNSPLFYEHMMICLKSSGRILIAPDEGDEGAPLVCLQEGQRRKAKYIDRALVGVFTSLVNRETFLTPFTELDTLEYWIPKAATTISTRPEGTVISMPHCTNHWTVVY